MVGKLLLVLLHAGIDLLTMSQEVTSTTIIKKTHIKHQGHEHELELKNYQKPYKCDGCKAHGYGSRYRCELCDFDLHEECMFTSPKLTMSSSRNPPSNSTINHQENAV
jgi:hypothetical protein